MSNNQDQIIIVGAGPTGLAMACFLTHLNIPFRIFEKSTPPCTHSKALAVQAKTLECLDKIGLAKTFVQKGSPIQHLHIHQGKKHLIHLDVSEKIKSPFNFTLALSQHETETIFLEYLKEKNIQIEIEVEIKGIEKKDTSTLVHLESGNTIETKWLLACDGAHSLVRNCLNLGFIGTQEAHNFWLADLKFDQAPILPHDIHVFALPIGSCVIIPFPKDTFRFILSRLAQEEALTAENLSQVLAHHTNIQANIQEVVWISKFTIHYRLAEKIRLENTFLLGDAFHVHSPVGGQGMNTGIQDAFNLAWKLALVQQNTSPLSILDSYEQERYENAQTLLKNTKRATHIIDSDSFLIKILRMKLLPFLLKHTSLSNRILNANAQLRIHYRKSSILDGDHIPAKSPNPGERLPNEFIYCYHSNQKKSLLEITCEMKHHLLFFIPKQSSSYQEIETIQMLLLKQNLPVEIHFILKEDVAPKAWMKKNHLWADRKGELHGRWNLSTPCLFLVRPDGYLGYVSSKVQKKTFESFLQKTFNLHVF